MSNTMQALSDPYRVQAGDTLSSIAKRCGQTVSSLQRWNGLKNPNSIAVGQTMYLSEASAFGVTVTFLDALRHPIANLPYRIHFDRRAVTGKTGPNGVVPRQVTRDARSSVEVWVQDASRQWQQLTQTVSGYGHKLITLVSDSIVVPTTTAAHPSGAPAASKSAKAQTATSTRQAKAPTRPSGKPTTNNPAVTTRNALGDQGQPIVVLGVDLPDELVALFKRYTGDPITEQDWSATAGRIECDANVLKAIAEVETKGKAFWRLNRGEGTHMPAILYERHYFSHQTQGNYNKDHPDISWPTGYQSRKFLGQANAKMHDGKVDTDDVYADYASSYLRLIQAFRLNQSAALESCSWGKFQIMGANWKTCGAKDVQMFVQQMGTSERVQVALLAQFIRSKPRAWKDSKNKALGKEISLWDAVKTKNWRAIAFNYNGPAYEKYNYHTQLEKSYEHFKQST